MYDTKTVPHKHGNLTFGEDEFGEFGSVFAPETDLTVPEPENLTAPPHSNNTLPANPLPASPSLPHVPTKLHG